jgi:stringent starvation protein B
MSEISTKPYLIRAIYEWCADAGFTPYLSVKVDQNTRVPMEYVKNGEIVLSISQQATRDLTIGNDLVQFSARFNGVSREISVPIYAVQGIFARENGRGVFFDAEAAPEPQESATGNAPSPTPPLQAVPNPAGAVTLQDQPHDVEDDSPDKPKGPPRGNLRVIK